MCCVVPTRQPFTSTRDIFFNTKHIDHIAYFPIYGNWLVVVLTILKNYGVRQWEGWHPIMENKTCLKPPARTNNMFHTTNQSSIHTMISTRGWFVGHSAEQSRRSNWNARPIMMIRCYHCLNLKSNQNKTKINSWSSCTSEWNSDSPFNKSAPDETTRHFTFIRHPSFKIRLSQGLHICSAKV